MDNFAELANFELTQN